MTGIDGVDLAGAGFEEDAREAARGSTDVGGDAVRDAAADRRREGGERGAQLRLAGERLWRAMDDGGVARDTRVGVLDREPVDEDVPRTDRGARVGERREALGDEVTQVLASTLGHDARRTGRRRAAIPAASGGGARAASP